MDCSNKTVYLGYQMRIERTIYNMKPETKYHFSLSYRNDLQQFGPSVSVNITTPSKSQYLVLSIDLLVIILKWFLTFSFVCVSQKAFLNSHTVTFCEYFSGSLSTDIIFDKKYYSQIS